MIETLKKGVALGLGIVGLTEKQARAKIKELEKEGIIKGKEAEKLLKQLLAEAKVQKEKIAEVAESEAKKHFNSMDKKSRQEILLMKKKMIVLEKKVEAVAIKHARKAAQDFLKATKKR